MDVFDTAFVETATWQPVLEKYGEWFIARLPLAIGIAHSLLIFLKANFERGTIFDWFILLQNGWDIFCLLRQLNRVPDYQAR